MPVADDASLIAFPVAPLNTASRPETAVVGPVTSPVPAVVTHGFVVPPTVMQSPDAPVITEGTPDVV